MEFKNLNAAIYNRKDSEPTIYSAICVVEQMFKDYEAESNNSIDQLPIGDEKLPNKLLWLCDNLSGIYDQTKGQFVRNKDRVAGSMEGIESIRAELKEYAKYAELLSEAQEQSTSLEHDLEEAKEKKRQYDALEEQCASIRAAIDSISKVSLEEKQAELAGLKAENENLRNQIQEAAEIQTKIEEELQARQKSKEEYDSLDERCRELRTAIEAIPQVSIDEKQAELDQLEAGNEALQKKKEELDAKETELNKQNTELNSEKVSKEKKISELSQQKKQLEETIPEQEKSIEELQEEHDKLKERSNSLSVTLGVLRSDHENIQKLIERNVLTWDQEKNAIVGLVGEEEKKLQEINNKLEQYQAAVGLESFNLLCEISEKESKISLTKENNEKKKKEIEVLDAQISNGNKENEGLLKQYNEKMEMLNGLQNTDEKRKIIMKRMEDADRQIKELENVEADTRHLEEENEKKQEQLKQLETRRQTAEDEQKRLNLLLTPERDAEIKELDGRLSKMMNISVLLAKDSKYLFEKPYEEVSAVMKGQIDSCRDTLTNYRKAIIEYRELNNA